MRCECCDHGCAEHRGSECFRSTEIDGGPVRLWRIDMDDTSGTDFCAGCAEDALASAVFTSEDPALAREEE